jgi:hypothetical protein
VGFWRRLFLVLAIRIGKGAGGEWKQREGEGEIPHSSLLNLLSSFLGGELDSLASLLVEEKGLMVSRWEAKGALVVGSLMVGGVVAEVPVWMRGKLEMSSMYGDEGERGGDVPCGWDSAVVVILLFVVKGWGGMEALSKSLSVLIYIRSSINQSLERLR